MGPGPFVEALEYASGKKAIVVGKPQLEFFQSVLQEFNCLAEETVMIGDVSICHIDFINGSYAVYHINDATKSSLNIVSVDIYGVLYFDRM